MRSAVAGTKVARVVCINSVGNSCVALFARERFHSVEKFVLAVIAAIGAIGDIERIIKFPRLDKFVAHSGRADEFFGVFAVVARKTCGKRRNRERTFAQSLDAPPMPNRRNPLRRKMPPRVIRVCAENRLNRLLFLKGGGFIELTSGIDGMAVAEDVPCCLCVRSGSSILAHLLLEIEQDIHRPSFGIGLQQSANLFVTVRGAP